MNKSESFTSTSYETIWNKMLDFHHQNGQKAYNSKHLEKRSTQPTIASKPWTPILPKTYQEVNLSLERHFLTSETEWSNSKSKSRDWKRLVSLEVEPRVKRQWNEVYDCESQKSWNHSWFG